MYLRKLPLCYKCHRVRAACEVLASGTDSRGFFCMPCGKKMVSDDKKARQGQVNPDLTRITVQHRKAAEAVVRLTRGLAGEVP